MPNQPIPSIEILIEQLHGADWTARCDAARLLGWSRDPRAVDALLPDLDDADWRVRRNAAHGRPFIMPLQRRSRHLVA